MHFWQLALQVFVLPSLLLTPNNIRIQEIRFLASMHGFSLEEIYGEMDLNMDLSHEEAYRMIAVLKKS